MQTYQLTSASTRKKFNVAKFSNCRVDFNKFAAPVHMVRDTSSLINNSNNPEANDSRHKIRLSSEKMKKLPWLLEDAVNENGYTGNLELQQSNYVLFMKQDNELKVIPVSDWYNFRPKRSYKSLSLEEAEAKINTKRADRWKNKLGGPASGRSSNPDDDDRHSDSDKFDAFGTYDSDEEEKEKGKDKKGHKRKSMLEEEMEEAAASQGNDFEEVNDDDDDDFIVDPGPVGKPPKYLDDEHSDSEKSLSAEGKEIKTIIQKSRHFEDEDENEKEKDDESDGDDSDKDSDKDDPFHISDHVSDSFGRAKPKVMNDGGFDGSNIVINPHSNNISSILNNNANGKPNPDSTESTDDSGKKTKKKRASSTTHTPKKPKKTKGEDMPHVKKEKSHEESPPKNQDQPPPSSSSQQQQPQQQTEKPPKEPLALTEEAVRKILLKEGKMKTTHLIKKFKGTINDPASKEKFKMIVTKIASLEDVPPNSGVKYLVLKPEYR